MTGMPRTLDGSSTLTLYACLKFRSDRARNAEVSMSLHRMGSLTRGSVVPIIPIVPALRLRHNVLGAGSYVVNGPRPARDPALPPGDEGLELDPDLVPLILHDAATGTPRGALSSRFAWPREPSQLGLVRPRAHLPGGPRGALKEPNGTVWLDLCGHSGVPCSGLP